MLNDFNLIEDNDDSYVSKFGTLFTEFNCNNGVLSNLYYPLHLLRNSIFALSQIYLRENEILQSSSNLFSSLIVFFYLCIIRPFKERIILITNIVIEGVIGSILLLILCRSFFKFAHNDLYFDFIFISLLIFVLGFQYIISLMLLIQKIKRLWIEMRKK